VGLKLKMMGHGSNDDFPFPGGVNKIRFQPKKSSGVSITYLFEGKIRDYQPTNGMQIGQD